MKRTGRVVGVVMLLFWASTSLVWPDYAEAASQKASRKNEGTFKIAGDPIKFITSIGADGRVTSINAPKASVSGMGLASWANVTGKHKLIWQPKAGKRYEVEDIMIVVGIRPDSPKYFDFACVAKSLETVPKEILNERNRQRALNADSVFTGSDFPAADRVIWLGKISQSPKGEIVYQDF
jgi:hypothetical protein